MKRDLWVLSGGTLAVGCVVWVVWGHPESLPRMHTTTFQEIEIKADPDLKLVSERSPYMRSER